MHVPFNYGIEYIATLLQHDVLHREQAQTRFWLQIIVSRSFKDFARVRALRREMKTSMDQFMPFDRRGTDPSDYFSKQLSRSWFYKEFCSAIRGAQGPC